MSMPLKQRLADGTLAGSTLTLDQALRNLVDELETEQSFFQRQQFAGVKDDVGVGDAARGERGAGEVEMDVDRGVALVGPRDRDQEGRGGGERLLGGEAFGKRSGLGVGALGGLGTFDISKAALLKPLAMFFSNVLQIFHTPSIGQFIVDHNPIIHMLVKHHAHKIAANEACPPCNKNIFHKDELLYL